MIFILLLSSICLCVKAENGYGYEVEVVPLKDSSEVDKPFNGTPTGGYTFLGFGAKDKNAPNSPENQPVINEGRAPEMNLGPLNTVPDYGNRHVMDLVLVLDSSFSITSKGWMKSKNAAKKLIDSLDISPQGTHVAIMKFSTDVEVYYMFDPDATKEKLKQLLDDLQYDGEWSRTDLAMKSVDRHVFTPIGGARPGNVPKTVVIFSDGKSDGPSQPEEEIDWEAKVAEPVKSLRNKNVGIFSVAVGVPDKRALQAIAGSPDRVFDAESMENLATAIENESLEIPTTEPPPLPHPLPIPPRPQTPVVTTNQSTPTTSTVLSTCTAIQTVTLTTAVVTTPVTVVIATETQTSLLTATETASTLVVTATETDTVTETVTATATQSLTSTALDTATSTVTATEIATEVLTLTTTVGVTSTTYAKATATPIPITIMGSVQGKKKNKIPRVKRWYEDYLPNIVKQWMAIKD